MGRRRRCVLVFTPEMIAEDSKSIRSIGEPLRLAADGLSGRDRSRETSLQLFPAVSWDL